MTTSGVRVLALVVGLLVGLAAAGAANDTAADADGAAWRPFGLMRVRDMTPFGILRLDMLPAHAITAAPGEWGLEANLTWQNTYVMSANVEEYLAGRGGRERLSPDDVAAILALPGDVYFVDGEFGLLDLTVHRWIDEHWCAYATIPYYHFEGGFLDWTIESFHGAFGFSSAGRDLMTRNDFGVVARVGDVLFDLPDAPDDGFGDPVLGLRYALFHRPARWNLVLESAVKVPVGDSGRFTSTGGTDLGVQLTFQRISARGALYASFAAVLYDEPVEGPDAATFIPTAIVGYERRLSDRSSAILQLYASPSVIQDTDAAELADEKFQVTLGLQTWRGRTAYRVGITENLSNFSNTPDIGITLQAGTLLGRR